MESTTEATDCRDLAVAVGKPAPGGYAMQRQLDMGANW